MMPRIVGLIIGLLLGFAAAAPAAPLPAGKDAFTDRELDAAGKKLLRKMVLEDYNQHGRHNSKWDAAAREFLQFWTDTLIGADEGPGYTELEAMGRKLVNDMDCADPMVRAVYGIVLSFNEKEKQGEPIARKALMEMHDQHTPHDVLFKGILLRWLYRAQKDTNDDPAATRSWDLAEIYLRQAAQNIPAERLAGRTMLDLIDQHFMSTLRPTFAVQEYEDLQDSGKVNPWALNVLGGRAYIEMAWQQRGGSWAHTVNEQGWEGFARHMAKARDLLLAAHKQHPDRPEAATALLRITLAGHGPEGTDVRYWFDQAVKAQFDYTPAYTQLLWAYRPRWGGSHERMLAFGRECLATQRFDTDVPLRFLTAVRGVVDDLDDDWALVLSAPGIEADLQKMLVGFRNDAHRKSLRQQTWLGTMAAGISMRAGRWEEAAATLKPLIEQKADFRAHAAFEYFGAEAEEAVGEIRARGESHLKDKTAAAQALLRDAKFAEAAEQFRALAHELRGNKWIANFYKKNAEISRIKHELQTQHRADLHSKMGLAAWDIRSGKWWTEKDQAIGGVSTNGGLSLMHLVPIAGNFEITADVEFHYHPYRDNFNVYFYFGGAHGRVVRVSFYLYEGEVRLSEGEDDDKPVVGRADMIKNSSVRIVVRDGKVDVYANGQQVLRDVELEHFDPATPHRFGVGGKYWYEGARPKWRNLQLRLLKADKAA